jgi:hypothetical protein
MGELKHFPTKLERGSHLSGEAICIHCKHEFVAVAPVGTINMTCPSCGTEKALFKHPCEPTVAWVCQCGCHIFMLSPQGVICYECGDYQVGWEPAV